MSLPDLQDHLLTHLGPFTYAELTARASRDGIAGAVRRGEIVRVLPNRYASAVHASSWHVRALAAADWAGGAIAGEAALALAGLHDPPRILDIAIPQGVHKRGPAWARLRTLRDQPANWIAFGRRVVVPPWAVVQAFSWAEPARRAERVFEPCRRGVKPAAVRAAAVEMPRVGGRRQLLACLDAASCGAESYLEMRAARILRGPLLGACVRQHVVNVDGQRFRVDAFHAASASALEFDGEGFHGSADRRRRDRERDALLASVGIMTLRFGFAEVRDDPKRCRRLAEKAIATRLAGFGDR